MTPTPRTDAAIAKQQAAPAAFSELADVARQLERELEEAKATHALEQRLTKAMAEEALHMLESRRLHEELTANKAALEKAKDILEEVPTRIENAEALGEWSGLDINPSLQRKERERIEVFYAKRREALTAINELKEAKP